MHCYHKLAKRVLRHGRLGEQITDIFLSLTVCAWGDIFRSSCLRGCCQEMLRRRRWPEPRRDSKLGTDGGVPEERGSRLPPTNSFRETSATVGLNVTSSLFLTREEHAKVHFYDQRNHLWYLIGFDSHSCSGAADQALPVHRSTIGPITGSDSVCWQDSSHTFTCSVSALSNEAWTLCINCRMWWHTKIH